MGKLFLQINVSVDGYIEDSARDIDWHFTDAEFGRFIDQTLESIDGMIFGRVSFEKLAQYWPAADPADTSQIQVRRMQELPKYCLSSTVTETGWHNSSVINTNAIAELKTDSGRDLALFAGAGAAQSCARFGLIDEYRLIMNPIQLGGGTPLFGPGFDRRNLDLVDVGHFASGALVLTYRPID